MGKKETEIKLTNKIIKKIAVTPDIECRHDLEEYISLLNHIKRNYRIREMKASEYPLLNEFIYEAIFIPKGAAAPPKEIINNPDLQVYVSGFGTQKDDHCVVAEADSKVIGAAWVRIMNDYGHVDDQTPSLATALYKPYRGLGIGTAMLKALLALLQTKGYQRTSLAVQKANYALKMYQDLGYQIVAENETEYIMIKHLGEN